jgi:hypothetical protein
LVDLGSLLLEPCVIVVIHVCQVGEHDPGVLRSTLGLGVKPFGLNIKPLHLYGLFGEVDIDGSRGLLLRPLLLIPLAMPY